MSPFLRSIKLPQWSLSAFFNWNGEISEKLGQQQQQQQLQFYFTRSAKT